MEKETTIRVAPWARGFIKGKEAGSPLLTAGLLRATPEAGFQLPCYEV